MKTLMSVAVRGVLGIVVGAILVSACFAQEGVALAIVYDTSGSMADSVKDGAGGTSPKYRIANRALESITKQIEAYITNAPPDSPHPVNAGLVVFEGKGAKFAVPWGPFQAGAMRKFARAFSSPKDGTPLGTALETAGAKVLESPMARKHVLVITDGMNTIGPDPAQTMPGLLTRAREKGQAISVHFVAFDVNANVFAPVKRLGATVLGASDEQQLNTQLEYILQRKILLEEEEPPRKN